jgi:hypothetical protein
MGQAGGVIRTLEGHDPPGGECGSEVAECWVWAMRCLQRMPQCFGMQPHEFDP